MCFGDLLDTFRADPIWTQFESLESLRDQREEFTSYFASRRLSRRPDWVQKSDSGTSHFWTQKNPKAFLRLRNAKFSHLLHFLPRSKVKHAFKAEKVVFRERNRAKTEKCSFLHSWAANFPSKIFRFLPKQMKKWIKRLASSGNTGYFNPQNF